MDSSSFFDFEEHRRRPRPHFNNSFSSESSSSSFVKTSGQSLQEMMADVDIMMAERQRDIANIVVRTNLPYSIYRKASGCYPESDDYSSATCTDTPAKSVTAGFFSAKYDRPKVCLESKSKKTTPITGHEIVEKETVTVASEQSVQVLFSRRDRTFPMSKTETVTKGTNDTKSSMIAEKTPDEIICELEKKMGIGSFKDHSHFLTPYDLGEDEFDAYFSSGPVSRRAESSHLEKRSHKCGSFQIDASKLRHISAPKPSNVKFIMKRNETDKTSNQVKCQIPDYKIFDHSSSKAQAIENTLEWIKESFLYRTNKKPYKPRPVISQNVIRSDRVIQQTFGQDVKFVPTRPKNILKYISQRIPERANENLSLPTSGVSKDTGSLKCTEEICPVERKAAPELKVCKSDRKKEVDTLVSAQMKQVKEDPVTAARLKMRRLHNKHANLANFPLNEVHDRVPRLTQASSQIPINDLLAGGEAIPPTRPVASKEIASFSKESRRSSGHHKVTNAQVTKIEESVWAEA